MTPNAADWLLATLADKGVEVLFGNPGSTELPLIDALARQDRIRYVLGLHEATVVGMADGYAQTARRLGVVNVHVQPGLANALSGILNAARARVPLLVTVGQQVTSLVDRAPFLGGELVALAAPVAKRAVEATSATQLPALVATALDAAVADPCGPVVVSLPMDVMVGVVGSPASPTPPVSGAVAEHDLARAAELLARANAPAILAGDGVVHAGAHEAVAALAERVGAPVFGEPFASRVPIPTAHPLWRGPLPGFAVEIHRRLAGYDVVMAVGMPVFRLFGDSPGSALPPAVQLIHVDCDAAEVGRTHPPAVGVVGPVGDALRSILVRTAAPVSTSAMARRDGVERSIVAERRSARSSFEAEAAGGAISPAFLCRSIAAVVTGEDLVVDEALTSGRWLRTALLDRNTPDNWLAHRGSALGWGLPAAVGAKMADPSRRVVCVHGDGSFLFGVHALWTAARERLGVAVVVADNAGYEILRAGLEGLTGHAEGAWPGLALTDPSIDLVSIARGFGASAERVDARDDLAVALADLWARTEDGPAVLVVGVSGRTPPVGYPLGPSHD